MIWKFGQFFAELLLFLHLSWEQDLSLLLKKKSSGLFK